MPDQPPPARDPAGTPPAGEVEWRLEVGRARTEHPRRALPFTVTIGWPAADRVSAPLPWPVPETYDAGLRFDVVDALLEQWEEGFGASACWWLTRPGIPSVHDEDLRWYAAAAHVFSAHGTELVAARAVTRTGWLDVVTGEQRVWRRLRLRDS